MQKKDLADIFVCGYLEGAVQTQSMFSLVSYVQYLCFHISSVGRIHLLLLHHLNAYVFPVPGALFNQAYDSERIRVPKAGILCFDSHSRALEFSSAASVGPSACLCVNNVFVLRV